jgi:hypothetical protein
MEGVADDAMNVRTSVACTVFDRVPLVTIERSFMFYAAKKNEGDQKASEKPKERIDDLRPVALGFRAAWSRKDANDTGRLICMDGERLAVLRGAQVGEYIRPGWRVAQGWVIVEHLDRRECMIYMFDPQSLPYIASWIGPHAMTLEQTGPSRPVMPDDSVGITLGMAAGELCGARPDGAWVACRKQMPHGGTLCAVIGRTRDPLLNATAKFALGGSAMEIPISSMLIPGIGMLFTASAEFADGQSDDLFDVAVSEITSRRWDHEPV